MNGPKSHERALDITERSSSMPPDSAILYRNKKPKNAESPHYFGLTKFSDGRFFWIGLWVRQVKGEPALEIRISEKHT